MKPKRLLIVGGVAGGASCAARARRLAEDIEIVIFERGPHVSFANCGLPYYVGDVITDEEELLVASPELFANWFNVEVRTRTNVCGIDRVNRSIEIEDLQSGRRTTEPYDALVVAPGAMPLKPGLDGIDLPGIFTLRNIPDARQIMSWTRQPQARRAVVIGGGFIGLEMAENLHRRGIKVTIVEMLDQVMPTLDPEMASYVQTHLLDQGIALQLGDPVAGFEPGTEGGLAVKLASGTQLTADMAILAIGVRPETELIRQAGLPLGPTGGIRVDDHMQTPDDAIWAVGDAVEVAHYVSGDPSLIPLAGPANRQGRIAAEAIVGPDGSRRGFRGSQGTAICGVLDLTIAMTGLTEKGLQRKRDAGDGVDYEKIYLHPFDHARYYPGAERMTVKLVFSRPAGRLLGAQAVGGNGVAKRMDVLAMAIQQGTTVFDLEEAELCYAPQYGSAKDPVNMAGMIAANVLRGQLPVAHWADLDRLNPLLLDVREPEEYAEGHAAGAINMPLGSLRARYAELPRGGEIWTYCKVGQRSYYAARILQHHGFNVKSISGGFLLHPAVVRG